MVNIVLHDEDAVIAKLTAEISKRAKDALDARNVFRVGLSGGSVINFLSRAIPPIKTNFSKWRLFFCDERYVPESSPDSTFGAYKTALLSLAPIPEESFVQINPDLSLEDCAKDYEDKILKEFNMVAGQIPEFDLLILGMGPDGHTCSLFPDHHLLRERRRLVAPIYDSPKTPPRRVTMTYPLINNAKCCLFVICGSGKADLVKRIFVDREIFPTGLVAPTKGELICLFDQTAGRSLPKNF